jgi:hypothetical protein
MGVEFSQAIAWIKSIKEKAEREGLDLRTAAWILAQELRRWQEFGGLEKAISTATNQLSLLNTTLEQQKQAIATLVHLQKIGITEAEIGQLVKLVGRSTGVGQGNGGIVGGLELDNHLNLDSKLSHTR